ncbi:MAG: N-acetylmuramoyl-L-alanine amidase [Deltaproteobacteria bacterium]|nr:N-acetylmuramoyl-L-alanine amidase [Deltaproteobacteria bacterium]
MSKWKGIVGRSFTPEEFLEYVRTLSWEDWVPAFIVLHNTEEPSLAMRPQGIDEEQIEEWVGWYRDHLGWSAGPHVFVDDRRIWVFTPLTTPGVHANSWNSRSLGVEMLGDFRREEFDSGRGLLVQQNAVVAVAILSMALGLAPESLMFHKENGETEHDCPGENVGKEQFIQAVKDCIARGST